MSWVNKFIKISISQTNGFFFVLVFLFFGFFLPELFYKSFLHEPKFNQTELQALDYFLQELDSLNRASERLMAAPLKNENPSLTPSTNFSSQPKNTRSKQQASQSRPTKAKFEPFLFDPNMPDSIEWLKLGLTSRQIRTVFNYVSKGGKFKFKEDFLKIYGISEDQFNKILPYVDLPSKNM